MQLFLGFELIREAGIRIPSPIGPTIGIVGALLIGESAVAGWIVSPILVINVGSACLMAGDLDPFDSLGALMLANELPSGLMDFSRPGDQAESTMLIHHVDSFGDLSLDRDGIEVRFRVVATASLS